MRDISTSDTLALIEKDNEVSIIDVRETFEVRTGIIPGAKHIPLGQLPNRINEIEKNQKEHIIVCRSGNRSKAAVGFLHSLGYKVANMVGGMEEWRGTII